MHATMKRMNHDMAVSPIVATLVLIVVAVIGAVAVGTIMGTFSSDVSKQANANQAGSAAQSQILIAGSTTVDPITQLAGKIYTAQNPGVKIVSQATGSGAGLQAVGQGIADIGAMSENPSSAQLQQFPNLKTYQIGSGAIVVITNKAKPANTTVAGDYNVSFADLQNAFSSGSTKLSNTSQTIANPHTLGNTLNANTVTVYRADGSGTADSFFTNYLGFTAKLTSNPDEANSLAVNGNPMMVQTVGSTNYALGFADYGDAIANINGANSIVILGVQGSQLDSTYHVLPATFDGALGAGTTKNWNYIRSTAKGLYQLNVEGNSGASQSTNWPAGLIRPLNYITNGAPNSQIQNYISFVQSNPMDTINGQKYGIFQETNNYGIADLA
ncbi:substrate-binding domain-containing protein [Methanoregula sp.]|uniref:substrate-binding domain-containing protein n=1 Tax=Methanoregula sp. TaxID=2052170 RepID=UPI0025F5CD8F|nr:substrate-binding domain-containing protein [Methanoregula sp.]